MVEHIVLLVEQVSVGSQIFHTFLLQEAVTVLFVCSRVTRPCRWLCVPSHLGMASSVFGALGLFEFVLELNRAG